MNILLLNPPVPKESTGREGRCTASGPIELLKLPPLSLMYPAAVLERSGFNVKIYDGVVDSDKELLKTIENQDLIVFNISPATYNEDLKLINEIKKINSSAHFSCFGVLPTIRPEMMLNYGFDSVMRREIEDTIVELSLKLNNKKKFNRMRGLSFISNGKIVHNSDRKFLDLDKLPLPARYLIDPKKYRFFLNGENYATVLSSRGCPYDCIFCTAPILCGKKHRCRSVENVIAELKKIKIDYSIKMIAFYADTFTLNRRFVVELCEKIIREKLNIEWVCNSKVDKVNEKMLYLMHKAGCICISYGIESGSQKILNTAKKDITLKEAENSIKMTKNAGIETVAYFMFGLPGETKKTVMTTIKFAKKLDPDYCTFSIATPYIGTEFYNLLIEQGQVPDYDERIDHLHPLVRTEKLKSDEIKNFMNEAYKEFYFRPNIIIRETKKVISNRNITRLSLGFNLSKKLLKRWT